MATMVVALGPIHDIKDFDCGNDELNTYLVTTAGQHQRKFISKTYVLAEEEHLHIVLGLYTSRRGE
ncbi:MAG: hypothetical protein ABIT83_26485 [Massilia sp.]